MLISPEWFRELATFALIRWPVAGSAPLRVILSRISPRRVAAGGKYFCMQMSCDLCRKIQFISVTRGYWIVLASSRGWKLMQKHLEFMQMRSQLNPLRLIRFQSAGFIWFSLLNRSPLPRWHWEEGGGGPGHRISGRLRDPPTGVADYLPISIELQVVEQQSHPPLAEWRLQRPQWAALLVSTFMQISRMQMRQFDSFLSLFIFLKDICTRTESGKLRTAPSSTSPNWSNCKWHLYANFMLILC